LDAHFTTMAEEEQPAAVEGEEAAAEEEPVKLPPVLTEEIMRAFYDETDVEAQASALAEALAIPDHTGDPRSAIKLDLVTNTLLFAKDSGFSEEKTLILNELGTKLLDIAGEGVGFSQAEASLKKELLAKVSAVEKPGLFTPAQVTIASDYFANGFFKHYKLYDYVYTEEREVHKSKKVVYIETAMPPPPLASAWNEEQYEAHLIKVAEEEEAARIAKEEEEQAAKEEAERIVAEEEAARKAAEEEELLKRKPRTLEEAVEHSVREKLTQEKAALEAQYAAREAQLLEKIVLLESQVGGAAA